MNFSMNSTALKMASGYLKSKGWVYGYALHLTATRDGFPVMFDVLPANVNERKVFDKKQHRLLAKASSV